MMLVYLLNTLADKHFSGMKLSKLWKRYDKYIDLGELNYKFSDDNLKNEIIVKILKYYNDNKRKLGIKKIYTIDGINVVAGKYWFTLRQSNTEPLIRLRIEGRDKNVLLKVKNQLEKFLVV